MFFHQLVAELTREPTSPWNEYSRLGKVTQRQVADLLEALDIFPTLCGPERLRGYLLADFDKAFSHFGGAILSSSPKQKASHHKPKKAKTRG
jgi:hypothetical protein